MGEKIVFIDRDGVINRDPGGWTEFGYVTDWKDFIFLPDVLEAFAALRKNGFKSVIISNQQCVGKGYCTRADLDRIDAVMKKEVEKTGGKIDASYYCVHRKEENCLCRKPKEGLFLKAMEDMGIKDISRWFFIGDTKRDIEAGKKAGLGTILVLSGKSGRKDADSWEVKPDYICEDLMEAAQIVIKVSGKK
jgi:histidinol-phosphate phosphatase family protein